MDDRGSFWKTLPGVITAIAGLIAAVAGLLKIPVIHDSFGQKQTHQVQTPGNKATPNQLTNGQLYALGVNIGGASVQVSVAMNEKSDANKIAKAREIALSALNHCIDQVSAINAKSQSPLLDLAGLKNLVSSQTNGVNQADVQSPLTVAFYNTLVAQRSAITATLAQDPSRSMLVHSFTLGVNIAIAEAQATVGQAARQVVLQSLTLAEPDAQALQLNTGALDECIALAGDGTTPMPDLYTKIVAVRAGFQGSLP